MTLSKKEKNRLRTLKANAAWIALHSDDPPTSGHSLPVGSTSVAEEPTSRPLDFREDTSGLPHDQTPRRGRDDDLEFVTPRDADDPAFGDPQEAADSPERKRRRTGARDEDAEMQSGEGHPATQTTRASQADEAAAAPAMASPPAGAQSPQGTPAAAVTDALAAPADADDVVLEEEPVADAQAVEDEPSEMADEDEAEDDDHDCGSSECEDDDADDGSHDESEFSEASDAKLDADWVATAQEGDFRALPGALSFVHVVVVDPDTRAVATVCSVHGRFRSACHHLREYHRMKLTSDLYFRT